MNSQQQQKQKPAIHIRPKHDVLFNTLKRRRLSLLNNPSKQVKQKQLSNTIANINLTLNTNTNTNVNTNTHMKTNNNNNKTLNPQVNNNVYANKSNQYQQQYIDKIQKKRRSKTKNNSSISYNDTIENNYLKIQMMRQQQRNRLNSAMNTNSNTKNMLAFFPTYTTLMNNQSRDMYMHRVSIDKDIDTMDYQNKNNKIRSQSRNAKSSEHAIVQRQKLAPLRKVSQQPNKISQNLNLSFFNIQKLSLIPINPPQNNEQSRNKNSYTANLVNNKRALIIPRQSFDSTISNFGTKINQINNYNTVPQKSEATISTYGLQDSQITNIDIGLRSYGNLGGTKLLRPFNPPFQRFYYFDFIWKVAFSNKIKAQFVQYLPKKYKVYIGPGNNSMLIKTFFKRRQSWWAITDRIDDANFVWTQIKVNNLLSGQKDAVQTLKSSGNQIQSQNKKRNGFQYKRNGKILNPQILQNWLDYFEKNKDVQQKLTQTFSRRNKIMKTLNFRAITSGNEQLQKIKLSNHLPRNYVLGNKKALFETMKKYYELTKQQVFQHLPLTFHIEKGLQDKQYFKFLQYFYKKAKQSKQSHKIDDSQGDNQTKQRKKVRNIWIVKPGQFTNRGNGITVCRNLQQIKNIVKNKRKLDNGNNRTYIVQQYLDRPFLYYRRKFDIRHYMMISCVNGYIKGYWYQLGYIRTTSYQYSVKNSFSSVHLTNDAVQKMLPDYGKYEKGNKISYQQFEKYLERQYKGKYSFYKTIYPQMKKIACDSMRASALILDQQRKQHNFEIFGFDFMIDANFHPWLIQINTNPCLQLSCPVLMDVIPDMVENALKISVDSILHPPYAFTQKRQRFNHNILDENKFELLYDSAFDQEELKKLYENKNDGKEDGPILNHKELEKDQDQVYEDDGVQLDD